MEEYGRHLARKSRLHCFRCARSPVYNSTLPAGNPSRRQERPGTLPEQPPARGNPIPEAENPSLRQERLAARKTLSQENPQSGKTPQAAPPRATLPEQFLQFGGVVAGEDNVVVSDGVGQEVAGGLGGEPQDGLGAAEIGFGLAP